MSYILSGDSGTVVFDRTGTITNESPTMSSQVTSNPIEGGGKITDHAVLDPIKFSITGHRLHRRGLCDAGGDVAQPRPSDLQGRGGVQQFVDHQPETDPHP